MRQPFITMSSDGGSIGRVGWHNFNLYNKGFGYVWWGRSWPWIFEIESIVVNAKPKKLNVEYTLDLEAHAYHIKND